VASDVRDMKDKADILLNEEAIRVNQDPSGIGGQRVSKADDGGEIWAKPLTVSEPEDPPTWAAILYNSDLLDLSNREVNVTLQFSEHLPGWDSAWCCALVRDLWLHQDLGNFTGSFSAEIDPHAVRFLQITALPTIS